MVNVMTLYPKSEGCTFDFNYYLNSHMVKSVGILSKAKGYLGVSVEKGTDSPDGHVKADFVAICSYYFESTEDFLAAFLPHAEFLQGDIVNYTNILPKNQISSVEIWSRSEN